MCVGATIELKYMEMLRTAYKKIKVAPKYSWPLSDTGFRGPMKEQFEISLKNYIRTIAPRTTSLPLVARVPDATKPMMSLRKERSCRSVAIARTSATAAGSVRRHIGQSIRRVARPRSSARQRRRLDRQAAASLVSMSRHAVLSRSIQVAIRGH